MYWEMIKNFLFNPVVKYFLLFCFVCYILFVSLSMFTDIDYLKKQRKKDKNQKKLNSQKQVNVSESEI